MNAIRKWCCTVNCSPSFSEEILTHLKRRKQKPICNLVIDEMSIRQQLILKNGKTYGPVDLGLGENEVPREIIDQLEEDNDEEEVADEVKSSLPPLAKQ